MPEPIDDLLDLNDPATADLADAIGRSIDPELLRRLVREDPSETLNAIFKTASKAAERGDRDTVARVMRIALTVAKEWQRRAKDDRQTGWDPEGDLSAYDAATEKVNAIQDFCDKVRDESDAGRLQRIELLAMMCFKANTRQDAAKPSLAEQPQVDAPQPSQTLGATTPRTGIPPVGERQEPADLPVLSDAAAAITGDVNDDSHLSAAKLAELFGVDGGRLRSRLNRWRGKNDGGWIENSDRHPREAKYVYRVGAVRPILDRLKATTKRPAKKN
jgi:hypothetical protein